MSRRSEYVPRSKYHPKLDKAPRLRCLVTGERAKRSALEKDVLRKGVYNLSVSFWSCVYPAQCVTMRRSQDADWPDSRTTKASWGEIPLYLCLSLSLSLSSMVWLLTNPRFSSFCNRTTQVVLVRTTVSCLLHFMFVQLYCLVAEIGT